ncbi:MAG TPA: DUF3341 domain-containing protein [Tepidisphaeraceae bacterium]|jgi:hypothetical protein|nr:DUF3341 domain-containing protein [Tepidisphaeraceae bacterium]
MPSEPTIFALAAEFLTPEAIVRAVRQVHQAGYRHTEAYTPYPIEGLPESLGFRRTRIPLAGLIGGVLGAVGAYWACWYANAVSYTWNIGNRPLNSWEAYISIIVDIMIAGAFFCLLAALFFASGLPEFHHPLFNLEAFSRATRDRYFLCIEAADAKFDLQKTHALLTALDAVAVYPVPK